MVRAVEGVVEVGIVEAVSAMLRGFGRMSSRVVIARGVFYRVVEPDLRL